MNRIFRRTASGLPASADFARGDLTGEARTCGECSLCCTVLRVDELDKLGGARCPKLREGGGCSIHPTRPAVCRAYRCLWLRGAFESEDRPDKLGAVVDFASEGAGIRLMIEEAEPGLFDRSPRLQGIAERFRATLPVRIAAGTNVMDPERPYRILGPNGADHRFVGEWVETLRDGVVVERQRLSPSARFLRRAILRFQAWRLVRQTRPRSWA